MDSLILKSFLPEIFLSVAILLQLVFNARLINNLSFNFPIIDKEIFVQTLFVLFCLFCLFLNLKIEGFFSNFIFINEPCLSYKDIMFNSPTIYKQIFHASGKNGEIQKTKIYYELEEDVLKELIKQKQNDTI